MKSAICTNMLYEQNQINFVLSNLDARVFGWFPSTFGAVQVKFCF